MRTRPGTALGTDGAADLLSGGESADSAGPEVIWLDEADSALDVAHELTARGGMRVWDSVLVGTQRRGRGQMRRSWVSPPGNIHAALRLPEERPFASAGGAVAAGFLAASALAAEGVPVRLKWPNDIVVETGDGPRKIAGILLEERGGRLTAGIGVNVASAPDDALLRRGAAMPAARLADACPFLDGLAAGSLWRRLVKRMVSSYAESSRWAETWAEDAARILLWLGCRVIVVEDGAEASGPITGVAVGLNADGSLRLLADGREIAVTAGSVRPAPDEGPAGRRGR